MPQILVAIVPGETLLGGLKRIGILVDDISSTPWRTVGIPFCPGCPTMGAPLALK